MSTFKINAFTKLIAVACGAGALFVSGLSIAATDIDLSYNGAPDIDKNAVHLFASNLKKLVAEKTDGELNIKLYPNSMLGEEDQRMEQVMNMPSLNIASFAGISPLFPEIYVSAIPFLFKDFTEARNFFDNGKYWQAAKEEFNQRTDTHLLAVVEEGGFLAFTNNKRPIKKPSDFEGLRFRAMDKSQVALYEAFGASGTPIPWTEVYMAMKTGVADGQMNPPMYIILGSLNEVQQHLTLANIQYSDQFLVANDQLMTSLTVDQKQALAAAVEEANQLNRQSVESKVEERVQYLADNGMTVYRPTAEELTEFQDLAKPSYINWLKEQNIDQKWIDLAIEDVKSN